MVEIYNEDLRDLLAPLAGKQKKAQVLQIKVGIVVLHLFCTTLHTAGFPLLCSSRAAPTCRYNHFC